MSFKAVIFDIDGTLADNVLLCVEAYRQTLELACGRPFSPQEIKSHFGKADDGILAVYLSPEQLAGVLDQYYHTYEALHPQYCRPVNGLEALIRRLHEAGVLLAVVTGKSQRGTEITLRYLGLRPYLSAVEPGFDEGANKPESLRRVLSQLGLHPQEAVYVGDTAYDIEAAASVDMPAVGAAWTSTHTITGQAGEKALHVFDRVVDFEEWVYKQVGLTQ